MASWRKGTTKQYKSYLERWEVFCRREKIPPHNPGMTKSIEFLGTLFKTGLGYSAINTAWSAVISDYLKLWNTLWEGPSSL